MGRQRPQLRSMIELALLGNRRRHVKPDRPPIDRSEIGWVHMRYEEAGGDNRWHILHSGLLW
jgi:hypothetical protein